MALTKEELLPLLRDPDVSRAVHTHADTDESYLSAHHTIGPGKHQTLNRSHVVDLTAPDTIPPAVVTGVTFNSAVVTNNDGTKVAEVTISWAPVTENADTSPIDDLAEYRISWKKSSSTDWSAHQSVDPDFPVAYFYGFKVGDTVDFRVRAVDETGNKGDFGYSLNNSVVPDTTGPNTPSTPVIINRMGALRIQWDGKDQSGGAMPKDFAFCEVHVSSTNGFTPTESTKYDSLPTAGAAIYSSNAYTTTFYVKLVAYDKSGNASGVSNQASGTPLQGVDADFANVNVSKLIAGKLSADIGLAGRLKIGPLNADGTLVSPTGARVEIDSTGVHVYNSSNVEVGTLAVVGGVPTISIQGPVIAGGTITGATIQTATSGPRWVITSNYMHAYSGHASELEYGYLTIDNDGSRGWVSIETPRFDAGGNTALFEMRGGNNLGNNSDILLRSPSNNGKITLVAGISGYVWISNSEIMDYNLHPYPHWGGTNPRTINGSTKTWTGGAAAVSHSTTVSHNLGTGAAPICVVATYQGTSARYVTVSNLTSTTFDINVRQADGTNVPASANHDVDWIAIG